MQPVKGSISSWKPFSGHSGLVVIKEVFQRILIGGFLVICVVRQSDDNIGMLLKPIVCT